MLAKKTAKNQITLPRGIVRQLPDAEYFDVSLKGGEVVLRPVVHQRPRRTVAGGPGEDPTTGVDRERRRPSDPVGARPAAVIRVVLDTTR